MPPAFRLDFPKLRSQPVFRPTAMALAPDGRIFVCEQGEVFGSSRTGSCCPRRSLHYCELFRRAWSAGSRVHPNFASNQYVYVYYTATTPAIHNRISRFTANGDVAVPGSEVVILELNDLSDATNP